jgi:hypothetical protein
MNSINITTGLLVLFIQIYNSNKKIKINKQE